jgi:hypothetical protein
MITTALGWLGLSVLDGKTLRPLLMFAGVLLALVAGMGYTVHTLTALGYEKAQAECAKEKRAATDAERELSTQLREASRENMILFSIANAKLPQLEAARIQKVAEYVQANPDLAKCRLDDVGLRIFNQAITLDDPRELPVRSGLVSQGRAELAGGDGGRSAFVDDQPRTFQGRPFGFVATPRPPGDRSRKLPSGSDANQTR